MEEISFKGEKYVKASVIAEKLGYTADYVGQLCRSKQVDATLVGRSWYVSEKSIGEHKKSRYRSTLSKSKESVRKFAEDRTSSRNLGYGTRKTSYGQDDSDLFPVIAKEKKTEDEREEMQEVPSRDVEPIKLDNKPHNHGSINLSERPSPRISSGISPNTSRALPPVRVISTKAVDMNIIPQRTAVQSHLASPSTSREQNSASRATWKLPGVLSWAFLLIVAVTISLSLIGLEKRIVLIEGEGQVILYNFSLEHFETLVRSFFDK